MTKFTSRSDMMNFGQCKLSGDNQWSIFFFRIGIGVGIIVLFWSFGHLIVLVQFGQSFQSFVMFGHSRFINILFLGHN